MMLTSNYGLKKPEGTDPVDVQDFNDNADKIDAELKKRPESDGDASDMTVEFSEAKQLTELTSNDSLGNLFGKLKLAVKNLISLIALLGSTDVSAIGDGTITGILKALNTDLSNLNTITWIVEGGRYFNTANLLSFKGTNYVVHVMIGAYLDSKQYRFYQRFQIGSSISTDETYYFPLPSFTYEGNKAYYAVIKMDNWVMSLNSVVLGNIDKTADATVYIGLSVG